MTQVSIAQYGYLIDAVDPFLHLLLLGAILLVLLEAAVLLGNVRGSAGRNRSED